MFHAASVGDWGLGLISFAFVDGTQHLIDAAADARVERFLPVSSISVYGHVDGATGSRQILADRREAFTVGVTHASERRGRAPGGNGAQVGKIRATILRPSWLYGPRDRATLPRLIKSIRGRKLRVIGDGTNRLNVIHAANVAEASVLAVESDRAIGEAAAIAHTMACLPSDGTLTWWRTRSENLG